ncbi:hypothetical protein DL770_000129 [Monosporascus sp. CRB-9-2]|nr:hypothetical protein DL770_000129 [Monosporascus sp. CRB-9-2]
MAKVDNEVKGRLALITGASGGIGAACARDLWGEGASLALTYFQNRQSIDVLLEELTKSDATGRKITVHCVDTGSPDAIAQLFDEIKAQHGQAGPDILISNAGYGKRFPGILDVSLEEFDYTININLRASFILTKLSIPHMEAQGWGRIIFISSIAAIGGGINACQYAASKAGLSGMMKNLAMKHARSGITVNDVAPAMIGDTGMIPDEKFVEGTPGDVKNIPVGRLGTPQECANVVTMMCRTGYLTGQSILLSDILHAREQRPNSAGIVHELKLAEQTANLIIEALGKLSDEHITSWEIFAENKEPSMGEDLSSESQSFKEATICLWIAGFRTPQVGSATRGVPVAKEASRPVQLRSRTCISMPSDHI